MGKAKFQFRRVFEGSSASFVSQVVSENDEAKHKGEEEQFHIEYDAIGSVKVSFGESGYMTVRGRADEVSADVLVSFNNDDRDLSEPIYIEFESGLVDRGSTVRDSEPDLHLGRNAKPGRHRNPAKEYAIEQVHRQGRPVKEVYLEWLEMRGPEEITNLDNPYKSFKKAIKH